jgi:cytochrome oxidase assembly protein ShyY1
MRGNHEDYFRFISFLEISLKTKLSSMKGQRISVTGTFDHSKEIILGPRSAPGLVTEKAQGMATNPQGYFIITPLYLNDG